MSLTPEILNLLKAYELAAREFGENERSDVAKRRLDDARERLHEFLRRNGSHG